MDKDVSWVPFIEHQAAGTDGTARGCVEIDGQMIPAWWHGNNSVHTTCWVTRNEVEVQHWRYHSQYDYEPVISINRVSLMDFCLEQSGRDIIERHFGKAALKEIHDQASRCLGMSGIVMNLYRARLRLLGRRSTAQTIKQEATRSQWQTGLIALMGIVMLEWWTSISASRLIDDIPVWWHSRVIQDMRTQPAKVSGHKLKVYTSDGSWGHKNNPSTGRKTTHTVTAILEVKYPLGSSAPQSAQGALDTTFDSRTSALSHMKARYPIGLQMTVYPIPDHPQRFLLSLDQAPTIFSLLGGLVVELILLLFIRLPLVLLACMLTASLLDWLCSRLSSPVRTKQG